MTSENKPKKGEFYLLEPDMRGGRGHGVDFEDEKTIPLAAHLSLPPGSGGLAALKETPRLRYDSHVGDMPNDLERGFKGYWLVSEPLKQVFESVDPEGFAFVRCEFLLEDGSAGEPHYLCEVVRTLDAIDEAASTVKVLTGYPNGKYYSIAGGASFAFKKEAVEGTHVFMDKHSGGKVYCDKALRDALIENGFGKSRRTRGVRLIDAADI